MRRNEVDAGSQPVRNLATNPGFETSAGSNQVVRTNYCPAPSAEGSTVNTTTRTNLALSPQSYLSSGWFGVAGVAATTTTGVTCNLPPFGYMARVQCTGTGTGSNYFGMAYGQSATAGAAATPGNTYTASAYVRVTMANFTQQPIIRLRWKTSAGATISDINVAATTAVNGQWIRLSATGVAPATTAYIELMLGYSSLDQSTITVGDTVDMTGVLIETASSVRAYFDGYNPAATRTNLCHNPTLGAGSTQGYAVNAGGGAASGAYNSGTGYSGTGFYRATWTTASTGNPYLEYSRSASPDIIGPGKVFTFSGYVRSSAAVTLCASVGWANSVGGRISGQDGAGVALAADTWTRVSMTTSAAPAGTAGAWFDWKVTSGTMPVGGTLDIDAILIEEGSTLGAYFDGSTTAAGDSSYGWRGTAHVSPSYAQNIDYTYAWNGTAHASTTREVAATVNVWNLVSGVASVCSYDAYVSTKSYRIGINASGQGAYLGSAYATAATGEVWTLSAYVKGTAGIAIDLNLDWGNNSTWIVGNTGTVTLTGAWQRVSITGTVPATYDRVSLGFKGNTSGAYDILVDAVMYDKANYLFDYFDGSTAAAGDFTYNWVGTAQQSASEKRGTTLPAQLGSTPGTDGVAYAIQSTDWSASGAKSVRIIPTGRGNNYTYFYLNATALPNTLVRGRTYTLMAKLRMKGAMTGTTHANARKIGFSGGQAGTDFYTPAAPNAAGVYDMRVTFTVPAVSNYKLLSFMNGSLSDDVWYDNLMLVEGDYQGDFINPTQNVLAKWEGSVNNSTSVGYPPQLLDIAGTPALEQLGLGASANPTVDGFIARTIYLVYEVTDRNAGSWQVPMYYGNLAPSTGLTIQTMLAGATTIAPRVDFGQGGGSLNITRQVNNGRTEGIHVVAVSLPQGLTSFSIAMDGVDAGTTAISNSGSGWTSGQLRNFSASGGIKAVRSMVFYEEHSLSTKQALSRYLGNKYGANVA